MEEYLPFTTTDPRAIAPTKANDTDSGIDLYALDDVTIRPGEVVRIRTGIRLALPLGGSVEFIGKSGRAWNRAEDKPVGMGILAGLIDEGYRGELEVIATNHNIWPLLELIGTPDDVFGGHGGIDVREIINELTIRIPRGKACVQMVPRGFELGMLIPLPPEDFDYLRPTERGDKGFGSSDKD